MKGLLIKDFKLMKNQGRSYIMIALMCVIMGISLDDWVFVVGYMTGIGGLFALGSISYDEFDNGYSFLFSLPVTRRGYAVEKYGFGILMGVCTWLFALVTVIVTGSLRQTVTVKEVLPQAGIFLPVLLILMAVMLPFHLKYGGEKGRIAIFICFGAFFVIVFVMKKLVDVSRINVSSVISRLSEMGVGVLYLLIFAVSLVILLISLRISIGIMEKKEF
ncbi:MAG: ABC-2 transporter permease [Lachnospiraceae bacterium]|nr:ABC-2 transporter permease [Lachnospiraceae bacterium]